jgi:hypothetical protein
MGALEQIGLVFSAAPNGGRMIEPGALLRGSPRELLLFSMYLYQSLPHYVPKTTLEFSGGLHTPLAKTLELSNPSKKPITYAVRLEGAPCFRLPPPRPRREERFRWAPFQGPARLRPARCPWLGAFRTRGRIRSLGLRSARPLSRTSRKRPSSSMRHASCFGACLSG